MNLLGCTFLLLLALQPSSAYNQDALDHVLRTIEYLASVHGGVFSCIFYDLSQSSHLGVWNDVLTSPRLDHIVVKYVFDESFIAHHDTPLGDPRNPPAHPNAYETKIVSLMVNKPSIQRIKTIDDFKHTEVRFHEDLENYPHFLNDSIIGDLVVQGKRREFFEAIPGGAVFWDKEFIDVYYELAFDYNRMESFFVVLDQEYFTGIELYIAKYRSPYLEAFRYTHITLFEAGLFVLWQRQWKDEMRSAYVGRRPREDAGSQSDLSFEDMLPAWLALGVGFCLSILGFTGELVTRPFDSWWSQVRKRIAK
ncbi:hypothetical protein pipiens_010207 [Culex pipiens pipiens]|uniref:Uncharacterized protein n=1 Tax=Culex pipiens pipiens TaxID=38569 RepID=A0ABD1DB64_CULPP